MHRSGIYLIVIDVNDLAVGTRFWTAALGATVDPSDENTPGVYERLAIPGQRIRVLLQLVPESKQVKNRSHIDIATDNVEAEVTRLVALGAKRLRPFEGDANGDFWVLQDPFGNEFCVVTPEHKDFLTDAQAWV
jgi:predicted enzyme related to lactoylglutathione lyase